MINATVLNQDGTGALACLRRGNFSSITASQAGRLTRTNTALIRWYADDAGAVLTGTGSVPDIRNGLYRTLLTKDNTGGHIRVHSLMGQVKAYDAFWNTEVVSAVHGRIELVRSAATMTLGGNGVTAAVLGIPSVSGAVTVNTNHILAGVAAIADFRATLTQTGRVAAFLCAQYDTTNWSDATARTTWGYGLLILNSSVATGVEIGNCTTGIILGTATTGITFNGAVTTGIAIPSTSTTGISITGAATDAIKIATGAMTDGIEIASVCTNGINISGASTIGISMATVKKGFNIDANAGTGVTTEVHGADIAFTGTTSTSGGQLVGLNVVTTTAGVSAAWAAGIYAKVVQGATKNVNGYLCAAEFELVSTVANPSDLAVLVLNSTCTMTGSPAVAVPYIMCREYGSGTLADRFLRLYDAPVSDGGVSLGNTIFSDVNAAKTHSHSLSIMVGTTKYWIMCHSVAPD